MVTAQRDPMDPLSGFYQVSGGRWVFVHCNFPNHRDHNLAVLGVAAQTKEDTAAAAAKWEGKTLEEAFMVSGGCGAFARTTEEWAQHPQAAAVASLPLVEIVRIGDAPTEPLPRGPLLVGVFPVFWLYRHGSVDWAILIAIWVVMVGSLDNFVRPFLIARGGGDAPLILVVLGVLGGAMAFGLIGLFLGPTLLAVGYCILDEWSSDSEDLLLDKTP
jgi:hypothetical protein